MDPYQTSSSPNRFLIFILGVVIGAILFAGILYIRSTFFQQGPSESEITTKELMLSLSSPKDGETVSKDIVKISGNTGTSSIVIINGGKEDAIVEAKNGSFSVDYKLVLGENQLTITAYEEGSGNSRTQGANVLYLNENLEDL